MFIMSDILRLLILFRVPITIITAVMMALVQHDYKKLLGFHAVSQVGYMVWGSDWAVCWDWRRDCSIC
jgi:formate hydrogenlyase subunit 3/multisubunit Na+/H+ antiporter MnhD subunit